MLLPTHKATQSVNKHNAAEFLASRCHAKQNAFDIKFKRDSKTTVHCEGKKSIAQPSMGL